MMLLSAIILILFPYSQGQRLSEDENSYLQASCGYPGGMIGHQIQAANADTENHKGRARRSLYGVEIDPEEAPWVVAVQCSGTLISPRHVLTAAHCIDDDLTTNCTSRNAITFGWNEHKVKHVTIGTACLIGYPCGTSNRTFRYERFVTRAYIPTDYLERLCEFGDSLKGDIAVLELDEDVPFDSKTFPVCLKTTELSKGKSGTSYGYGNDPSGIDKDHRGYSLRKFDSTVTHCSFQDPSRFCTQGPYAVGCGGDSGSGLITSDARGRRSVDGVLTNSFCDLRSADLLRENMPDHSADNIFARVSFHMKWICLATGVCANKETKEFARTWNGTELPYIELRLNSLNSQVTAATAPTSTSAEETAEDDYNETTTTDG